MLVVEDNRDAADSLQMLLELFGYEVAVAYTGPDGVRAAAACRPDVVVCDIGLPGLDGYEVAAALRRDPATAAARLIAVTGYGADEDRRRATRGRVRPPPDQAGRPGRPSGVVGPGRVARLTARSRRTSTGCSGDNSERHRTGPASADRLAARGNVRGSAAGAGYIEPFGVKRPGPAA